MFGKWTNLNQSCKKERDIEILISYCFPHSMFSDIPFFMTALLSRFWLLCLRIHVCKYVDIHYKSVYMYLYVYVCMNIWMNIYRYICIYIYVYICVCVHIYINCYTCVCIKIHIQELYHHHHHVVLVARISLTLSRHSSLSFIAGLLEKILYPHIVVECMFALVVLLLHGHVWGSIRVHHLWVHPCFSSSVLHVWFV